MRRALLHLRQAAMAAQATSAADHAGAHRVDRKSQIVTNLSFLGGKIHSAQQILQIWVGAHGIESRINFQDNHPSSAFLAVHITDECNPDGRIDNFRVARHTGEIHPDAKNRSGAAHAICIQHVL